MPIHSTILLDHSSTSTNKESSIESNGPLSDEFMAIYNCSEISSHLHRINNEIAATNNIEDVNHKPLNPVSDNQYGGFDEISLDSFAEGYTATVDSFRQSTERSATALSIPAPPDTVPTPPNYNQAKNITAYSHDLQNYISNELLSRTNQNGKAPLWLRPLAAIASWFGYHGFGQTNCLSCSFSVANTLKQGEFFYSNPTLRGAIPTKCIELRDMSAELLNNLKELEKKLLSSGDLNLLLNITRPPSWWRSLLSPAGGHACNVIKTGNMIHLVDAQKKYYCAVTVPSPESEQVTPLLKTQSQLMKELQRFVGTVASQERSLRLYSITW
jgi:hypothetical protein